ncbi:hypothetical protein [Glaciecola sp. SC05]|uniref:hypothetical protein n=1 Tax=Glaciecola sp. SC05 TaxID=1987355 RepID=UPI003527F188
MSKPKKQQQELEQRIASLNRPIAPNKDLWQGIEYAIVNQQQAASRQKAQIKKASGVSRYLAIAASIVMFGFLVLFIMDHNLNQQGESLIANLSDSHQKQKQALIVSFADTPAATNNWEQQIADLDEAESAIKLALKDAPNNPALLKMLKQVYEQQLAIIERVHAPAWQQI